MFFDWPDLLPEFEIVAVNLPGRGRRMAEPSFTSLSSLARALARTIGSSALKPFAFFGHSMGSFVAYETARQLRHEYGIQPLQLFVSGAIAPHLPDPHPLHHLSDKEFFEGIRDLGGMPDEVLESEELIELLLPILRADFVAAETYNCPVGDPLPCPIAVFAGDSDPIAPLTGVSQWNLHSTLSVTINTYPGGHFFLNSNLTEITQRIGADLTATRPAYL